MSQNEDPATRAHSPGSTQDEQLLESPRPDEFTHTDTCSCEFDFDRQVDTPATRGSVGSLRTSLLRLDGIRCPE